jgi:hypothetical protein
MASLSLVLPVKPGQSERLRDFGQEIVGPRRQEFEVSEQRIGLTREGWYRSARRWVSLW